ncbi:hypothetical protein D9613_003129 [Agrocybe pediades]|uniref:Uncharacterized protein n=1 Tax=Agrocybe pediades TaxID=84607 RepID=A0A8H4VNP7_9AGAR|nr:hypothetical protein D9613_003129 [Agrocybe pediades]
MHLSSSRSFNSPTLPTGLLFSDRHSPLDEDASAPPSPAAPQTYSGPAPPKSWQPTQHDVRDTPEWRAKALEIVASRLGNFTNLARVPSLALLCVKIIISEGSNNKEFLEEILPYIPGHLRRDIIRHCAIHEPLPEWKLYALFNQQGHVDGEILVMGPSASLDDHHLLRATHSPGDDSNNPQQVDQSPQVVTRDWEEDEPSEHDIHTLILVSTRLSTSVLTSFPPTITLLCLVNLPSSVPLHRLVKLCPLLVLLDLSYNYWLNDAVGKATFALERIEWSRWNHIEILGLRDCYVSSTLVQKINKGRWDDVQIIR